MVGGAGVSGFGVAALSGMATGFSQPLATVLAGAGALGAGALAYINGQRSRAQEAIHHQATMERERERHREDSHRARESALRDRYTAVAAQIAHESAAIRQAGVYALTALADDWHAFGEDDERQVCINLLQWYLRVPLLVHGESESPDLSEQEIRQTIVGILTQRRRRPAEDPKTWADTAIDLSQVSLPGCTLSNVDVAGLSMSGADLQGANLSGADLSNAKLYHANLAGANLVDADLTKAGAYGADFADADLYNVELEKATMRAANLCNANLLNAGLVEADLAGANLTGADLSRTDLIRAELSGANLSGANLSQADLEDVKYTKTTQWPDGFAPPC